MNNMEKFKQKVKEMINKKSNVNRKEYQHNYYLAHREEILKRRKERYRKQKESNNGSKIVSSALSSQNI